MSDNSTKDVKHVRFSRRNDYKPMQPEYLSGHLRDDIKLIVVTLLNTEYKTALADAYYKRLAAFGPKSNTATPPTDDSLIRAVTDLHINRKVSQLKNFVTKTLWQLIMRPKETLPQEIPDIIDSIGHVAIAGDFRIVLDVIELIANSDWMKKKNAVLLKFIKDINEVFDLYRAAYWLDDTQRPYEIHLRLSDEHESAINTVLDAAKSGARFHLQKARECMKNGEYYRVTVESILMVESVARDIDPDGKRGTLSDILKRLKSRGFFKHPAFAEAFIKIYGYTSDAPGYRHAAHGENLPDDKIDDALVMFGICLSFSAYLISRSQQLSNNPPVKT